MQRNIQLPLRKHEGLSKGRPAAMNKKYIGNFIRFTLKFLQKFGFGKQPRKSYFM
jgi:hypothetical protein